MKLIFVLSAISLLEVNSGKMFESYEDYFDPVIDYLLNGNSIELSELHADKNADPDHGGDPVYSNSVWNCGICDNIDKSKLIYSENNDVNTNVDDDFLQVQIGLSFEEMRCVTIHSDGDSDVKRIAGDCSGPTVTLMVADAEHFVVHVYRN